MLGQQLIERVEVGVRGRAPAGRFATQQHHGAGTGADGARGHGEQFGRGVTVKHEHGPDAVVAHGTCGGPFVVRDEQRQRVAAAVGRDTVELSGALGVRTDECAAVRHRRREHELAAHAHGIEHGDPAGRVDRARRGGALEVPHRGRVDGSGVGGATRNAPIARVLGVAAGDEPLGERRCDLAECVGPQLRGQHLVRVDIADAIGIGHEQLR